MHCSRFTRTLIEEGEMFNQFRARRPGKEALSIRAGLIPPKRADFPDHFPSRSPRYYKSDGVNRKGSLDLDWRIGEEEIKLLKFAKI